MIEQYSNDVVVKELSHKLLATVSPVSPVCEFTYPFCSENELHDVHTDKRYSVRDIYL